MRMQAAVLGGKKTNNRITLLACRLGELRERKRGGPAFFGLDNVDGAQDALLVLFEGTQEEGDGTILANPELGADGRDQVLVVPARNRSQKNNQAIPQSTVSSAAWQQHQQT